MKHPNASIAGGSTGGGILVVWLLGNVFHLEISAELGAAIAGVSATALLFVGRAGIRGVAQRVWRGSG